MNDFESALAQAREAEKAAQTASVQNVDLRTGRVEYERITSYYFNPGIKVTSSHVTGKGVASSHGTGDVFEVTLVGIREGDGDDGPYHDVSTSGYRLTKAGNRDKVRGYQSIYLGFGADEELYRMHREVQA